MAIREGIRREKDIMSGCGSIAIDVNDDKVAPMVRGRMLQIGCYNSNRLSNNERRRSQVFFSGVVLRHRPRVTGRNPQEDARNIRGAQSWSRQTAVNIKSSHMY